MKQYDLVALGWTAELAASLEAGHIPARVSAQHRGAYDVLAERGEQRVRLPGRFLHEAGPTELPAVGDWVGIEADMIQSLLPRRSAFVRQTAGRETGAQVLAANVDTAFLVTSLNLDLEPRRLERYLTVAWDSGALPVILLTKADLADDADALLAEVEAVAFGVPVHLVSAVTGHGMDVVASYLRPGTTAVLLGSSGVGKSTLVNRLAGEELLRTQEIREDDDRGRHTTSHRELVVMPGGGMIVDTPGIRELQLWEGDTASGFGDIDDLALRCRFSDCGHTTEPGCAVLEAVDEGVLTLDRLRSYRKLERELIAQEARKDARLRQERRKDIRRFSRSLKKDSW